VKYNPFVTFSCPVLFSLSNSQRGQYTRFMAQMMSFRPKTMSDIIWGKHAPKTFQTRMWANAQRDGRPAEYSWRLNHYQHTIK